MNTTTLRLAQELAALSPCRPGVKYLARRLGLSERAVEYHLQMLREAGLLAYIEKGTRHRGAGGRASEYALVIPPEFDAALGIRTAGEGASRRATGIAAGGRILVAQLARKALRKVRAANPKNAAKSDTKASVKVPVQACSEGRPQAAEGASDSRRRCTPMEAGTSGSSSELSLVVPLEAELASGQHDHAPSTHQTPAPTTAKGQAPAPRTPVRRVLNQVGRRFELAAELIRQVDWLSRAHVPRVAWVVRDVSDAGWTCDEVTAWLSAMGDAPTTGVWRSSGLLASRLRGVTGLPGWRTAAERAGQVEHWRDSQRAARARHADRVWVARVWQPPATAELVADLESVFEAIGQLPDDVDGATVHHIDDQVLGLEDLTPDQVIELRCLGERDHDAVLSTIDLLGEEYARRLYTNRLVDWVLHKQRTATTAGAPW